MTAPNRRELLQRLQAELDQIQPAEERGQRILDDARAQLQRALDEDDAPDSLVERLEETIEHFEGTHPDFTNAIAVVINSLSNMGL
jgi:hypothetical protein